MIEFFFDCSSPWTYLAFHNIQPLAKEFGAENFVAADFGRRYLQSHQPECLCVARKVRCCQGDYMKKDLADWAQRAGSPSRCRRRCFR